MNIAGALFLWITMALELAWPSILPHGSCLLPMACGLLVWQRSTAGMLVSGLVLLIDWIARPTFLPLCPMLIPMTAVLCLGADTPAPDSRRRLLALNVPAPMQLPLLTLFSVALQVLSSVPAADFAAPRLLLERHTDLLVSTLMIALPVSGCGALLIRLADEFGLRRSFR